LIAAIGKGETFERGRDLAAWLGLVPRQFTTGGKPKLLGISKRGNSYLRKLLIHGARAALPSHGDALVNLGSGLAHPSGFAILDLLCGLSPRHEPARLRARSTSHSVAARTAAP
jgi:Transposase IS116/IS110/IS902 family